MDVSKTSPTRACGGCWRRPAVASGRRPAAVASDRWWRLLLVPSGWRRRLLVALVPPQQLSVAASTGAELSGAEASRWRHRCARSQEEHPQDESGSWAIPACTACIRQASSVPRLPEVAWGVNVPELGQYLRHIDFHHGLAHPCVVHITS